MLKRGLGLRLTLFHAASLAVCAGGGVLVANVGIDKILTEELESRTSAALERARHSLVAEVGDLKDSAVHALEARRSRESIQERFADDPRILSIRYYDRRPSGTSGGASADWVWVRTQQGGRLSLLDLRYPVDWETVTPAKPDRIQFGQLDEGRPVLRLATGLPKGAGLVMDLDPARLAFAAGSETDPVVTLLLDARGKVVFQSPEARYVPGEPLTHLPLFETKSGVLEFRERPGGPVEVGAWAPAGLGGALLAAQAPLRHVTDKASPLLTLAILWTALFGLGGLAWVTWAVRTGLTSRTEALRKAIQRSMEKPYPSFMPQSHSDDEIGRLSLEFQLVMDRLRNRQRFLGSLEKFRTVDPPRMPEETWIEATCLQVSVSGLCENLDPSRNATDAVMLLNDFLQGCTEAIAASGGVLDRFDAKGFMAFWLPNSSGSSIDAALEVCATLQIKAARLSGKRVAQGLPQIVLHAGLHSGPAFAAHFGPESRLEYTLIGEAPGVAENLHSHSVRRGLGILVTDHCAQKSQRHNRMHKIDDRSIWTGEVQELLASAEQTAPIRLDPPDITAA